MIRLSFFRWGYATSKHGHPRAWKLGGAIRVAYESVGRVSHHPTRESSRMLDAVFDNCSRLDEHCDERLTAAVVYN